MSRAATTQTDTTRAAVYVRASLDRTGEGAAIGRQEADCRALAAQRGWDVSATYRDNDISASSGKRRPGWEALLAAIDRGEVDVVVAYHIDRVARRMTDLERVIALGAPVATVTGDMDLSTDTGRLLARLLGAVAQGEVERKGARQRRANEERARQGKPSGGWRPFGFGDDRMTHHPEESAAVRGAYDAVLAGASLRSVARTWNDAGHRTSPGGQWRPDNVRTVLLSPRYAGLREYRGDVIGAAAWAPVVEEPTWRAVAALLGDPARRTTPGNARRYMLSGLATCGVNVERDGEQVRCGALLTTGRTQRGARSLLCSATPHLVRMAEPIEEMVTAAVLGRLNRTDAADLLVDHARTDVAQLRTRALALRARLDDLGALVADGTLRAAAVRAASAGLREELAGVEAGMADAGRVDVLGPLVAADDAGTAWEAMDVDRRRAVIAALLHVELLPPGRGARTLDPATVALTWVEER